MKLKTILDCPRQSPPSLLPLVAALSLAWLLLGQAPAAHAQAVEGSGNVNPMPPTPPPRGWQGTISLYVGDTGQGSLTIRDGGLVKFPRAYVGYGLGSDGTVTVTGSGSDWTLQRELGVGEDGTGRLTIQNGATVSSYEGFIGDFEAGTGSVLVSGPGSRWTNAQGLSVGVSGTGTLAIRDGGTVSNEGGIIGLDVTGRGAVEVSGAGSLWSNASELTVAFDGTGSLLVKDGGLVTSPGGTIGAFDAGKGNVTVTGAGAAWTSAGSLVVGSAGAGTLTLTDAGRVSVSGGTGNAQLGVWNRSTGVVQIGAASANASDAQDPGVLEAAQLQFGAGQGTLNFNHTSTEYDFATALTSSGAGTHQLNHYAGNTRLTGNSAGFLGTTTVAGGTLTVANQLGGVADVRGRQSRGLGHDCGGCDFLGLGRAGGRARPDAQVRRQPGAQRIQPGQRGDRRNFGPSIFRRRRRCDARRYAQSE